MSHSQVQRKDALQVKLAKLEGMLNRMRPEVKYLDVVYSPVNVPRVTGFTIHLSAIAGGTGVNQRLGNEVRITHVEIHLQTIYTASVILALNDNPTYRVYVVQDLTQIADTGPVTGDLVDTPGQPIYQLRNVNQIRRFKVLFDSGPQTLFMGLIGAGLANNAAVAPFMPHIHYTNSKLNILATFNGTASSDPQRNGIFLMISTDMSGAAGADILDVVGSSRIGFTDA